MPPITTTYDSLNRKQTIADGGGTIATYSYVGPGRVARRDHGNGTRTAYAYDGITGTPNPVGDFGVRRIIAMTHTRISGGTILDDRSVTWDRNKTRRKDIRTAGPGLTHDYAYDPAYRLVHTTVTDAVPNVLRDTTYNLDGVGSRTTVVGAPDAKPYVGSYTLSAVLPEPGDAQTNQYTDTPFDDRVYDKNGNLTILDNGQSTQKAITYDYRNQMIGYADSSAVSTYRYDALGRRIEKSIDPPGPPPAQTTRYFLDGWQEVEEQSTTGGTLATYTFGLYIDEVLNMTRAGVRYFYHADDLYNVMAVSDNTGVVVERYEYQDYGRPSMSTAGGGSIAQSAIANPFLFTGRRFDPETAWYYCRTRHLDPAAGRFTTRDASGSWGDPRSMGSAYTYSRNNPSSLLDPLGLQAREQEKQDPDEHLPLLNCAGYATGENCYVGPKLGEKGMDSFEAVFKKFGWSCTKVAASKACQCHCNEFMLMFYIYRYDNNPEKVKDPFSEPWRFSDENKDKGKQYNLVHTIKCDDEPGNTKDPKRPCQKGWSYAPSVLWKQDEIDKWKKDKAAGKYQLADADDWLKGGSPETRKFALGHAYCCCKEKK